MPRPARARVENDRVASSTPAIAARRSLAPAGARAADVRYQFPAHAAGRCTPDDAAVRHRYAWASLDTPLKGVPARWD